MLGLPTGISRFIGYYIGSGENKKVKSVEGWGLLFGSLSGILFGVLLFIVAPIIAPLFSEKEVFVDYIKIAAITLPFYAVINSLISISGGHQRVREKILFFDVGRGLLFLALAIITCIFSFPFIGIIWSMFAAISVISISFFIYYLIRKENKLKEFGSFDFSVSMGKRILLFSLPLLLVNILAMVMQWTDTIMIGIFDTEEAVGFYNIARPLSKFISMALSVSLFIYTPLVAGLYAQKKFRENDIIFSTITRWICILTLPLTMVLLFYGDDIISTFFGEEYLEAGLPLRILAVVFFLHNLMGPNGATLTAYAKTRYLMYTASISACLNIILNFFLIQSYGIAGAAVATGISIISINLLRVFYLRNISGIHPFKSNIIKPVLLTSVVGSVLILILDLLSVPGILLAIISFFLTLLLFLITMLWTKSISKQDLKMIIIIEKRVGIDLTILKRILKRFI